MMRALLILVLGVVMGCCSMMDATAQDDSVVALRAATTNNNCGGKCAGAYGSTLKTTLIVSNRTTFNGAKPAPSDPTDLCSLAVSYRTRVCIIGGKRYVDIVVVGMCSSPCIMSVESMMEKVIVRSLVPDNVLGIIDPSSLDQTFTWIFPPCWTRMACTVTSPSGKNWTCAGACECSDAFFGSGTMEEYCRQCCITIIHRSIDGSCNLVNDAKVQKVDAWGECKGNNYIPSMWPLLPITGTFSCFPLPSGAGPLPTSYVCTVLCPELSQAIVKSIPTAP